MKIIINKKKNLIAIIIFCAFLIICTVLTLDYFNTLIFISKNLNFEFLGIFTNFIVVILLFIITYILVEKKTFDIQQ